MSINQGYPLFELIDICARKAREHPLSVEAGQTTAKSRDCARVIDFLKQHGPSTCFEISQGLNMPYQTTSGRCADLKYILKVIEDTGERRVTNTGAKAAVLRLKEAT